MTTTMNKYLHCDAGAVVMVIATAAAALPGVTGLGVKLQEEPGGLPEQDKVTALANDAPTGSTLKL